MNSTQGHGTNQVNSTQSTGSSATPKDDEENIGNLNEGNRKEFPILGNQHTKNRELAVKEVIYPLVGNTTLPSRMSNVRMDNQISGSIATEL